MNKALLSILFVANLLSLSTKANDHELKWEFISNIFYTNSPAPKEVTQEEIDKAISLVEKTRAHEKKVFIEYLTFDDKTPDYKLWALAIRDTDNDGIRDYVVDEYSGKFREGDFDIDGDGIYNVFDSSPYNNLVGGTDTNNDGSPDFFYEDENFNSIPDHLDWSNQNKSAQMKKMQRALYENYKVILVERGFNFNESVATGVYDLVRTLFKSLFIKGQVNPSLRVVAVEENVYFKKQSDVFGATLGMYMGFNPTFLVFSETALLNKTYMLGVLAHELSHSYQYLVDYSVDNIDQYLKFKNYDITNFLSLSKALGFNSNKEDSHFSEYFEILSPTYKEPTRFRYSLDGKSMNEWRTVLNMNGMSSEKIKKQHIVSPYSLSGPWEWLSDQTTAYLFNEMDKYGKRSLPLSRYRSLKRKLIRNSNLDPDFQVFYYENGEGGKTFNFLKKNFSLSNEDLNFLIDNY